MLEPSAKTGSGAPCAEFRLSKGCLPTTVLLPASRMTCRTSMSATCKSLEPWSSPRATFSTLELRAHSPMRAVQSVLPPCGEKRETAARRRDACPSLRRFVPPALGTGSAAVLGTPSPCCWEMVGGGLLRRPAGADDRLLAECAASSCWERRGLFRFRWLAALFSWDVERHRTPSYLRRYLRLGQRRRRLTLSRAYVPSWPLT